MILQNEQCAYNILDRYGYTGYPFSDKRILKLITEDDDSIAKPSLHTLLASPQRDYVISNHGDKVPIHTLESKVVALYFWPLCTLESILIKMAYEEFRKDKKNFEVVLIYNASAYADTNKESFWELFKTMPWLALPYNDPNNKKLRRICEHSSGNGMDNVKVPGLVIFGPHGKFIDPCGEEIMCCFGVRAYPFTCAAAVKLEMEKTKDLKLEMLWDQSTVLTGKDGYKVPFSQLSGKRVIVIVELSEYCLDSDIEFLKMLKEMYLHGKGTCYEFEVIHIVVIHIVREGEESCLVRKRLGDMPWLVSNANKLLIPRDFFFFSSYYNDCFPSFVFFDRDGKMIRKRILPLNSSKTLEFPFCGDVLEAEAWRQLGYIIRWQEYRKEHPIYSLDKMNVPASARDFGYLSQARGLGLAC